ncbi:MAG TPA: VOC family protein [Polyangia bacterium]|jgi:hypothetical protein|nr:VOC family protein [Polyangia bacterium]
MSQPNQQGRIVWHDLNTTDLPRSKAFYSELFGWNVSEHGPWNFIAPPGETQHFGTMIGHEAAANIPSHWVPYLTVANIDAAITEAAGAGGKITVPKRPAGETGHFSYVLDPQMASFALWQYSDKSPGKPEHDGGPPRTGHFIWDELMTSDPEAAAKFYTRVVGYETKEAAQVPGMHYTLFQRPATRADGTKREAGGMMKSPPGVVHPYWLSYVCVDDCDRSAAKAKSLGGKVAAGPMDIPQVGRIATLLDPTGAAIGIMSPR